MSYTVNVTERLPRLSISSDYSSPSVQFEISDILDETVAAGYGISVGDTLTALNGEAFCSVVSQSKFKDPTCILWDTKLPFTLTLMRKQDKKDKKKMYKIPHPRRNAGNNKIDVVGKHETYSMAVEGVEPNLLETDSAEISEVGFDSIDSEISESDIPSGANNDDVEEAPADPEPEPEQDKGDHPAVAEMPLTIAESGASSESQVSAVEEIPDSLMNDLDIPDMSDSDS